MAFGGFNNGKSGGHAMAEINMIPLIDVMLVLLVIFMITAPMMTHSVKIDLPKASSEAQQPDKEAIDISIDVVGQLFWNNESVTREILNERLTQLFQERAELAELHLRADKDAPYHFVAETLADASKIGITQIGFISEPERTLSQ